MITREQLRAIRLFALDIDWNRSFGGKAKGNRHLFRVVKIAKSLAAGRVDDMSIVEASAWLHDSNLEKTIFGSTLANQNRVVRFLRSKKIADKDIQAILRCIAAHDGRNEALTIEAKIIRDADTLDKMGPLGVIRETWKRSQAGWNSERIARHLEKHLTRRRSQLHFPESRVRARTLSGSLEPFFAGLRGQL